MPQRKKTRSELLNEELNPFARTQASPFDEEGPAVEDFDAEHDADARRLVRPKTKKSSDRLRHRGPLDPSLSSGKYGAKPRRQTEEEADEEAQVDEKAIEGELDDLFGMFDADLEEGQAIDDPDEYSRYVESKLKKRSSRRVKPAQDATAEGEEEEKDYSHLDAGDADVMRQIQQLRATQKMEVTATVDESTAEVLRDETEIARKCVALTAELLAFRMKVQPAITKSVQLPQYYSAKLFASHSPEIAAQAEKVRDGASHLVQQVLRIATPDDEATTTVTTSSDKLWKKLQAFHRESIAVVHRGIERWGHRAAVATDPKLQAVNRPLLEQIQGVISGRQRLLRRAQKNRIHARIYGHPRHFNKTTADRAVDIADGDEDREIFDDGDFIKEMAQQHGGLTAALENFLPEDKSKSEAKKGHHRRTKGRTVNYDPHPKLVGFFMPAPHEESPRHEALLKSLFGGQAH